MAKAGEGILDSGDRFPESSFDLVSGDALELPRAWKGRYGTLLVYRGVW